ncbi:MAG: hypothetical protein ACJA2K_000024 [Thalassolituus sp.]|jgi:hypothetical protein
MIPQMTRKKPTTKFTLRFIIRYASYSKKRLKEERTLKRHAPCVLLQLDDIVYMTPI